MYEYIYYKTVCIYIMKQLIYMYMFRQIKSKFGLRKYNLNIQNFVKNKYMYIHYKIVMCTYIFRQKLEMVSNFFKALGNK